MWLGKKTEECRKLSECFDRASQFGQLRIVWLTILEFVLLDKTIERAEQEEEIAKHHRHKSAKEDRLKGGTECFVRNRNWDFTVAEVVKIFGRQRKSTKVLTASAPFRTLICSLGEALQTFGTAGRFLAGPPVHFQ